ncbi:hypothetical protein F2Q70_00043723 [Brassica cretica]|uniref:Uncharacterized protein n=1 Tax=Brassica cretica TaxID=69181 RepID=A0A8S9KII6_BRACR|nr:hypothetical protein F2Q70_00043723 [Brassica cretica]
MMQRNVDSPTSVFREEEVETVHDEAHQGTTTTAFVKGGLSTVQSAAPPFNRRLFRLIGVSSVQSTSPPFNRPLLRAIDGGGRWSSILLDSSCAMKTVKNIPKITKAMKMVDASKLIAVQGRSECCVIVGEKA